MCFRIYFCVLNGEYQGVVNSRISVENNMVVCRLGKVMCLSLVVSHGQKSWLKWKGASLAEPCRHHDSRNPHPFSIMQKKKPTPTPSPQGKTPGKRSNPHTPTKSPVSATKSPDGKTQKEIASDFCQLIVLLNSRSDLGQAFLSPSALVQLGIHSGELIKISSPTRTTVVPPFGDYASAASQVAQKQVLMIIQY